MQMIEILKGQLSCLVAIKASRVIYNPQVEKGKKKRKKKGFLVGM